MAQLESACEHIWEHGRGLPWSTASCALCGANYEEFVSTQAPIAIPEQERREWDAWDTWDEAHASHDTGDDLTIEDPSEDPGWRGHDN
jgi:hypothetical protein